MQRKQRGVFLIGATVAVAIVGMLLTIWMNQRMQEMRIQRAENIGAALKVIGEGVQSFVVKYQGEIHEALTSNPTPPVVLKDAGKLGSIKVGRLADSAGPVLGIGNPPVAMTADHVIRIMNLPGVGGKPYALPDANYVVRIFADGKDIGAVVYLDRTITQTYGNTPDWNMLSTAIRKIGVHGGFSKDGDAANFTFPLTPSADASRVIPITNPLGAPGLLAVRAGYTFSPMNSYLRLDGKHAMTGNLNMGAKDIVGVGVIEGSGGKDGKVTIGNELVAKKSIAAVENMVAGTNAPDIKATLPDGDDAAAGNIAAQGWVIAGKGLAAGRARFSDTEINLPGAGSSLKVNGIIDAASLKAKGTIHGGLVTGDSIDSIGKLSGNSIKSRSDVSASGNLISTDGAFLLENFRAEAGTDCSEKTGGIALNSKGQVVSCQGTTWQISLLTKEKIVEIEKIVDRPVPGPAAIYREWNIGEIPDDIENYMFKHSLACQLSMHRNGPASTKKYLNYHNDAESSFVLEVPPNERGDLSQISVGCISDDDRLRAVGFRGGMRRAIVPRLAIDSPLGGGRARWLIPANPPTVEKVDAWQADTYCPSWIGFHDWKYNVDLGHWDYCARLAQIDGYCFINGSSKVSLPFVTDEPHDDADRPRWRINTKRTYAGVMCMNFQR